ncbi:hypothetical protein ACVWZ6_009225 [Bradyrhizobium sp. GM6.1]
MARGNCRGSIVSPMTSPKGRLFALHAKALHGNPFDGHTLGSTITDMEKQTGVEARRIHVRGPAATTIRSGSGSGSRDSSVASRLRSDAR